MHYLYMALAVIISYLIGSISFAVIIGKLFAKKDIRDYGSGNAGMTNVMRVAGVLPGIITFLLDGLKCCLSCLIGFNIFEYISKSISDAPFFAHNVYGAWACGLACLLGHVFPVFFKFRGGKAVASGFGLLCFCCPLAALVALGIFIIIVLITKIVSAASILGAIGAFATVIITNSTPYLNGIITAYSAAMTLLIIVKHRENIKRILKGEEKTFKPHK